MGIGGEVEVEMVWQPLLPIPGPASDRLFPGATSAIVTVFVYSANNLAQFTGGARFPVGHLPSPQATVSLANYTRKSNIFKKTQQPAFNFGESLSLVQDWSTASLVISVEDTQKRASFGSHSIPLTALVAQDNKKTILPLHPSNPAQTTTISASISFPSSPATTSSSSSGRNRG